MTREPSALSGEKTRAPSIHWIHILVALILPFIFVTGFNPSFMPVKASVLVFGAAAICIALIFWVRSRAQTLLSIRKEHLYLAGFVVWMMLSIFWSPNFYGALAEWFPLAAAAIIWFSWGLYYSHEDGDNRKQFEMIQTVVLVGMIESIIVLVQYFGLGLRFAEDVAGKWRVIGTFGNPNYVAEFLVPVFFLALNLLHHETRTIYRKFYLASIFLLVLAIAATWSRTGWLLLAGGLILYAWIFTRQSRQRISGMLLLIMARARWYLLSLAAVLALILVLFPLVRIDRVLMRHATNTASISGRFFIWEHSLDAFVSKLPFGAGVGGYAKSWGDAQYRHFSKGDDAGINHAWVNDRAHNDLLQFAVEGGIGVIFLILFFIRIVRKGAAGFRHNDLSIGVFVALLMLLVSSLANFPFRVPPNLWLIMFLAALVSQHRHIENDHIMYQFDLSRMRRRLLLPTACFALLAIFWGLGHILSAAQVRAGDAALARREESVAREHFDAAVSFDPGNARAHVRFASLLADYGDMDRAGYHAQRALEILPFPTAWLVSARVALSTGSNELALGLYERRSTTYRKIPGFAADTIRALADFGQSQRAFNELKRLNSSISQIDLDLSESEPAILLANGAVSAARLAKTGYWYPAFARNAPLLQHEDGIWASDGGKLCQYQSKEGSLSLVREVQLPSGMVVRSLLSFNKTILVGSDHGLYEIDTEVHRLRRVPGIQGSVSWLAKSGRLVWLATRDTLIRYLPATGETKKILGTKTQRIGQIDSLAVGSQRVAVTSASNLFSFDAQGNGAWESFSWRLRDCLPLKKGLSLLVTDFELHLWRHGQKRPLESIRHKLTDARIVSLKNRELTISDGTAFEVVSLSAFTNLALPGVFPVFEEGTRSSFAFSMGTNGYLLARGGRVVLGNTVQQGLISGEIMLGMVGNQLWIADQKGLHTAQTDVKGLDYLGPRERVLLAGDTNSLCLVSGNELTFYDKAGPRVISRDLDGIRALAVLDKTVLVGYEDGRVVRHERGLANTVWTFPKMLDALALADGAMYLAVSGSGVFRIRLGETRPELILDGASGIDVSKTTAMYASENELYVGSEHGLLVLDQTSGSTRMIETGARGPVRSLTASIPSFGRIMAVYGDEVVLLGRRGRVLMRLQGGPHWPTRISSALAGHNIFAVAGETGVLVCTGIEQAMQPWKAFFRRNQ